MYSRKNNGVVVCRILRAKTPNPRFWCDASYLPTDFAFDCIEKTCRATLTSYFRSIRLPFSLTVASGTDTGVASMQLSRSTITIFGKQKSQEMLNVTESISPNSVKWDGELLKYGNAS